ncbi:MAG TPA: VOC family protein [Candidatus Paceibacterota bacterium]|nr:VOC family protein [Candidatus Paceibacterota bacterium]
MIEHFSLPVSDFEAAKEFYVAVLPVFGYELKMDFPGAVGFFDTETGHTDFWIVRNPDAVNTHVAFRAKDQTMVQAFYDAARKAGGRDNGEPGPRPEYSPDYYAAFVIDPVGNNIEAACFVEGQE